MRFPFAHKASIDEARAAGYRCAIEGANIDNCHFSLFATPELTRAWEEGKRIAEEGKRRQVKREFLLTEALPSRKAKRGGK